MWIRLKSLQHIERAGKLVTFRSGDWVDVGRQTAMRWIADGQADVPDYGKALRETMKSAGIVACGVNGFGDKVRSIVSELSLEVIQSDVHQAVLRFERALFWSHEQNINAKIIPVGLGFLEKWEIVLPLFSYAVLAAQWGNEDERARTKAIIRDLRVPMYCTGLMFVRRCENTERLMGEWAKQRQDGDTDELSFLRALYLVKPLVLALPVTWTRAEHDPELRA
jgi:hypothetical protein